MGSGISGRQKSSQKRHEDEVISLETSPTGTGGTWPGADTPSTEDYEVIKAVSSFSPGHATPAARGTEAVSRAAAIGAWQQRQAGRPGDFALQRFGEAASIFSQGRPCGLSSIEDGLEAFFSSAGSDIPAEEQLQMRTAVPMAEGAKVSGLTSRDAMELPGMATEREGEALQGSLVEQSAAAAAACAGNEPLWDRFCSWAQELLITEVFDKVNQSKTGALSTEELMVLFSLTSTPLDGAPLSLQETEQLLKEFDFSGTGHLGKADFLSMFHDLKSEAKQEAQHSPEAPPHLVLYFDVNNTVLIRDTLTEGTDEDLLSMTLAGCSWGIVTPRPGRSPAWVLVTSQATLEPPWEGLVSYTDFIAEVLPMPEGGSKEEVERIKTQRRTALRGFCKAGQPGEAMRPHLDRLVESLRNPQPLEGADPSIQATSILLPSFYHTLRELKRADRSFTVVFRTFGIDVDSLVQQEFNDFCEGKHPLFPKGPLLDGSDGGRDHRMRLQDAECNGTFFREPSGALSLVWGTKDQPPNGVGLEHYDGSPWTRICSGPVEAARSLEEQVLSRSSTIVLRDYYPGWMRAGFSGRGGKPVFLHVEDQTVHGLFFDDHIRPADPTIVDAVDERKLPSRLPAAQVIDVHLLRATAARSVPERDYFLKEIRRAEGLKRQQLRRRWKVAKMLYNYRAMHGVVSKLNFGSWKLTSELLAC